MGSEQQPGSERRGTGDVLFAVAALAVVAIAIALSAYWAGRSNAPATAAAPVSTPPAAAVSPEVAVGARAFVQFACAQCHGQRGSGGVSPDVPGLQSVSSTLTAKQLTSIIEHGAGVAADPTKPYMPVWKGVVSKGQIAALVAYIKAGFPAVPNADPEPVPSDQGDVVAGMALYERDGCVNCHGPNGLGGVPNPAAPDGTIPPLVGADFHNEFDAQAMADVIRSGSVLGKAPIVSMPHWGGILTDAEIRQLVAYINSLTPTG
jgi:mono/diheme cytochrome c family protein